MREKLDKNTENLIDRFLLSHQPPVPKAPAGERDSILRAILADSEKEQKRPFHGFAGLWWRWTMSLAAATIIAVVFWIQRPVEIPQSISDAEIGQHLQEVFHDDGTDEEDDFGNDYLMLAQLVSQMD